MGALVRRGWIAIVLGVVLGIAAGGILTKVEKPMYESSASVSVEPTGISDAATVANSRTTGINLDTEAQLARSSQVTDRVRALAKTPASVPTAKLLNHLTITVPPNTSVLKFTYEASSAASSAQLATAFATAYLNIRNANAQSTLTAQSAKVSHSLKDLNTTLRSLTSLQASLPKNSKGRNYANAQRGLLISQITTLNTEYNQLSGTVITPGRLLSSATVPTKPASPSLLKNVATGLACGLLIGLAIAWLRFARLRRMSRPDDVMRLIHLPVAATVEKLRTGSVEPLGSAPATAYQRMANLVGASIGRSGVVLLTGAAAGAPTDTVATNLAVSLARSGVPVSLLSLVDGPFQSAPAHDAPADDAPELGNVRTVPRDSSLAIVGAISRHQLDEMRGDGFLVVTVADAAGSPDAQTLAGVCDAILVVVAARTKVVDGRAAIDQLDAVGAPVLGAVLVPSHSAVSHTSAGRDSSGRKSVGRSSGRPGSLAARGAKTDQLELEATASGNTAAGKTVADMNGRAAIESGQPGTGPVEETDPIESSGPLDRSSVDGETADSQVVVESLSTGSNGANGSNGAPSKPRPRPGFPGARRRVTVAHNRAGLGFEHGSENGVEHLLDHADLDHADLDDADLDDADSDADDVSADPSEPMTSSARFQSRIKLDRSVRR